MLRVLVLATISIPLCERPRLAEPIEVVIGRWSCQVERVVLKMIVPTRVNGIVVSWAQHNPRRHAGSLGNGVVVNVKILNLVGLAVRPISPAGHNSADAIHAIRDRVVRHFDV